jgi:hypothetical protein
MLAVRTFAVWDRNRVIGIVLVIAAIADVIVPFPVNYTILSQLKSAYARK